MSEQNIAAEPKFKLKTKILMRLFPSKYCDEPDYTGGHYADVVVTVVTVHFSFADRLRLLFTGMLRVQTKTLTENRCGLTISNSVAFPTFAIKYKHKP